MTSLKTYNEFNSFDAVQKFYKDSEPATKKVFALLRTDPKTDSERDCLKELEGYICELDQDYWSQYQ